MSRKEKQFRVFNDKSKTMTNFSQGGEIMQSTGMVDVNSNLIYEHDYIFSYKYPFYEAAEGVFKHIGKVIYNYNNGRFDIEFLKINEENIRGLGLIRRSEMNSSYSVLEILGNSFEHSWEQILEKLKEREHSKKKYK